MTALLPQPESQYFDNNGVALSGGKIWTYIPSSTVMKSTFQDAAGVVLNTNPIILDSAGRALIYGTGLYRFRITDAADNLIYDENTAASLAESAISSVMAPVCAASSLATARNLMGIDAAIATAISGVTTLQGSTGPTGPASTVPGPTGPAGRSAGAYAPVLVSSNPGYAQFQNANGTGNIFFQFGNASTDSGGNANVTFATPFPSVCFAVVATAAATSWWANVTSYSNTGFSCTTSSPLHGGGWSGAMGFNFIAIGA